MFYKKIFFAILIIFSDLMPATGQTPHVVKWVVEKTSTLRVDGKTNVNSFTCSIDQYKNTDTIVGTNKVGTSIDFTGELQIDILSFDCHSNMTTKGLRKTLKADEYPTMSIRFISLECLPVLMNKIEVIKGFVEVELAAVSKRFELSYSFLQTGTKFLLLKSKRSFRFSDFKLLPPKKFGGLVKIKNDFDVSFQLVLREI